MLRASQPGVLWAGDFPGTSSASPFTNQYLANIVALQGPSRPCSVRICSYRLCPITGPSGRCPIGEAHSALSSSSHCLPIPRVPAHHTAPWEQIFNKTTARKEAWGGGEEGKTVSKLGHIKRLFPWQPLLTVAQARFNQWQHLPIKSVWVCTSFPCILIGMERDMYLSFGKQPLFLPWGSIGNDSWSHSAMMPTHAMERVQCSALSVYIASSKKSSPEQLSILFDPAVGKLSPWWLAKLHKKKAGAASAAFRQQTMVGKVTKQLLCGCYVLGTTVCQWAAWKGHAEEMNSSVLNIGHKGFCCWFFFNYYFHWSC